MRINKKSAVKKSAAPFSEKLTEWLDCDDLAAFIKSAGRTNPVRNKRRGALRADAQLRQGQNTIIGPAHALAAP
jgi:hypothetical protein